MEKEIRTEETTVAQLIGDLQQFIDEGMVSLNTVVKIIIGNDPKIRFNPIVGLGVGTSGFTGETKLTIQAMNVEEELNNIHRQVEDGIISPAEGIRRLDRLKELM